MKILFNYPTAGITETIIFEYANNQQTNKKKK